MPPRSSSAERPALFGFAYDPASHLGFGFLEPLEFRVESMGDDYFM
jgi:hypothetical protein